MESSDARVNAHYKKMTETNVAKLIVVLGIPTIISMLITNIYNLADTYFVGTLGKSEQGATGVLFTLQCIIQAVAFMMGHGSGVNVSAHLARRDVDKASKYATGAFTFGVFMGLVLMVFGLIFITPFMYLLGSTDTILPYAKEYGMWVLISAPFMIGSLVINNIMRYEGKAFYAMFGLVSGGLLNILGDYIFINVMHLGVFGAGMSTGISQIISFGMLIFFHWKKAQSRISIKDITFDPKLHFTIIRVGFPSLIRQGLTSISNGIMNNVCKPFGDEAIASVSVVNKLTQFAISLGLGIGQGFQPVSSFNYAAKRYDRVKKGFIFTTLFGLALVGTIALIFLIIPKGVAGLFSKDEDVIKIASEGLKYAALGVVFLPISVTTNMLYQSIRKAEIASILASLRSGLLYIPAIYILNATAGLTGLLWSQPIANILSAIISLPFMIYFLLKKYENKEVLELS